MLSLLLALTQAESYRRSVLKSRLAGFAQMIIQARDDTKDLMAYFPEDLRLSVIDLDGNLIFDSELPEVEPLPNHIDRPEIKSCLLKGEGTALRKSQTTEVKLFYYAVKQDKYIIRLAQNYKAEFGDFFRSNWTFMLFELLLLGFSLFILYFTIQRYKLKEQEREESQARKLKHEMTTNISHELKTPASSLQGYLETIVNHPELEEKRRSLFIERAYLQSLRLSDIIADISTLTKIEEAPELFKISPVNLKHVFDELLEEMREKLTEKSTEVENNLEPLCFRGSYSLIYSIFRNLLENTLKYAGGDCKVVTSYERLPDGGHGIEYYDTGKGVKEKELNRIFERFYRLKSDRAGTESGSGLGLSIVRNAVHFHSGNIRAYLVEGGGLGFKFSLYDLRL